MVCPPPGVMTSGTCGCRFTSSRQKVSALATSCASSAPAPSQNLGMTASAGSASSASSGVFSFRSAVDRPNGLTGRAGGPAGCLTAGSSR